MSKLELERLRDAHAAAWQRLHEWLAETPSCNRGHDVFAGAMGALAHLAGTATSVEGARRPGARRRGRSQLWLTVRPNGRRARRP